MIVRYNNPDPTTQGQHVWELTPRMRGVRGGFRCVGFVNLQSVESTTVYVALDSSQAGTAMLEGDWDPNSPAVQMWHKWESRPFGLIVPVHGVWEWPSKEQHVIRLAVRTHVSADANVSVELRPALVG
jgi:hypothetical protein